MRIVSVKAAEVRPNARGLRQSKVFFWPSGAMRPDWNRTIVSNRWTFKRMIREVLELACPDEHFESARFVSKCGCSRDNCSPGWVIPQRLGYDLHVMVED